MRHTAVAVFFVLAASLVCGASGCAPALDLENSRRFQQAEKVFTAADSPDDYLQAAGLYQQMLDSGVTSGAVLYNQGNAYMQAGEVGHAIAAYRRAQRFRPRDPYLDANLQLALKAHAQPTPETSIVDMLLFWQNWLSYLEKFQLVTLLAGLAFTLGLVGRFSQRRRVFRHLALVMLLLACVCGISAGYDWYRFDHTLHGVVTADSVTARKGNSANYEPAFTEPLTEGREFTVLEERGEWLFVRISQTGDAWIERDSATVY